MKTKILGWIAALGVAGSTFGFGACSQPKTDCQVALASTTYAYIAKYTVKGSAPAACEGKIMPGETLGMEFYHPPTADGSTYDGTKTTFAVQSEILASIKADREGAGSDAYDYGVAECIDAADDTKNLCLDNDPTHHPYSLGAFKSALPDDSDFCAGDFTGTGTSAAHYTFPAIPEIPDPENPDTPLAPALDPLEVKYEWKNMKVYVTAGAPGTQFSADLTYTENDCTVEYSVVGLWPAIYCGTDLEDGTTVADDTLCNPCAAEGQAYGSGINPDFPTKCDPDLMYCVLADKKDAAKKNDEKAAATTIPQILDTPPDCGSVE